MSDGMAGGAAPDLDAMGAVDHALLEAGGVGTWAWDTVTGRASWSAQTYRLMGREPGEPVTHKLFQRCLHPDDYPRVIVALQDALDGTRAYDIAFRVIHPDGQARWLLSRAAGERDAAGHPRRMVGIHLDVTALLGDGGALAAEGRLALALQGSEQGAWDWDLATGMLWCEGRCLATLGYAPGEIGPGMGAWEALAHPADQPGARRLLDEHLQGRSALYRAEYRVRAKDGQWRWVLSRGKVVTRNADGHAVRMVGTHADITASKLAEIAREESERRWRMAAELAGLAWWEWDARTGETVWSERLFPLCGYDPGAVTPSREAWWAAVHPEDRPRVEAEITRARETGERHACEYRFRHADGKEVWIEAHGEFAYGSDGMPVQMMGVVADITERKMAEARRELLARELGHRVKNLLMVVQSVALTSLRATTDLRTFEEAFLERLQSLARAHQLLTEGGWEGAPLGEVLGAELAAHDDGSGRVALQGGEALLGPQAALLVGLAAHELATNALKHGALSRPEGRVEVAWEVEEAEAWARVVWRETGGPAVLAPSRRGFGMRMLQALGKQAGGELTLAFEPKGLICRMRLPLCGAGDRPGTPSPPSAAQVR
jgi:PAS domain S-box-containing protein